ncbi:uncharacterized protein LOC134278365 isoform X2 [Saccostrea cucullata]|uniref:uncharacterized protein LOC134278365 isoform X2 n=1 Tax=Saccostrea cuccullata TaxID=36930 RepID=UPI002ED696B7
MNSIFRVVFPLLLFTVVPVWPCFRSCCNCGSMTPRDPYILLDSELVLKCTLNSSAPYDSSRLYFSLKPNNLSIPEREIPMNYTSIINKKTISLRKTMRSLEEAGYYYCKLRDVKQSISMVDRQVVELEYPLRNVTNFHCEIYDWDVNKTCTWDLGFYANPNNINVTLYGKHCFGVRTCKKSVFIKCPSLSPNQCRWHFGSSNFDSRYFRVILLLRNLKLKDSILRSSFWLEVENLVRPSPVKYLNIYNTTYKDCVTVTWEYNRPNRVQAVEIRYSKFQRDDDVLKTMILKNSAVNATICNLTAYTDYVFEIRVKPQNYAGNITGYWSQSTRKLYKTIGDNPSAAPVLTLGSYINDQEHCVSDMDNRRVVVLWKSITNMESNGNDTYYEVHYRQIGDTHTDKKVVKERIMKVDLDLKCRKGYNIHVYAINEFGLSSVYGSIHIPPNGTVEMPKNVQVETDNKLVNVSWDYNPNKNVSFTVYWCSKRGLRKEVSWKVAGFGKSSLVFNANEFHEISDLKFGVSADSLTDNISSGFEWITCVYNSNEAPASPRKVSILSNKDGLVINWIPPTCDGLTSKPVRYQLSWCQTKDKSDVCQGSWMTRDIKAHDSVDYVYHLSKQDVEMSKWYGIVIRSISNSKKVSPPTDMFNGRPVRSYMIAEEIIGIALAGIIGVIFFAVGVLFIIKHCYHAVKSAVKLDPIHLPTVQTSNTAGSGVLSAYKENSTETEPQSPIQIPQSTSPLIKQNGVPFQFQYSMDSGRGSLPVEDFLDHDLKHHPIPEIATPDGSVPKDPVPFLSLSSPLSSPSQESCLNVEGVDNGLKASSLEGSVEWNSSLAQYRTICQESDSSSDDETSSVASEMQEDEIKPYIKAGSHSSLDNMDTLPGYLNDCVKSGSSESDGERHGKCCSTTNKLLTHSSLNVTNCICCIERENISQNLTKKTSLQNNSPMFEAQVISSSTHPNPAFDQGELPSSGLIKLPALEMCNILMTVDSSCSIEKRLCADEVDNVSVNSTDSTDSQTSADKDEGSVFTSSGDIMASSDYLPVDSVQFSSSCFSLYDSSTYLS